jgi:hypothetical protein
VRRSKLDGTLAQLRALLAAGTPGPWVEDWEWRAHCYDYFVSREGKSVGAGDCEVAHAPDGKDAALIVAAVNSLGALLDVAEAAEAYRHWVDDEPESDGPAWAYERNARWSRLRAALAKGGGA